ELRGTISQKLEQLYGCQYHPEDEITITVGAAQAIFTIFTAFIRPMDEVIVFRPVYDCYESAIEVNGGIPVPVQLNNLDFNVDWEEFRSKITPRTKMIIIKDRKSVV